MFCFKLIEKDKLGPIWWFIDLQAMLLQVSIIDRKKIELSFDWLIDRLQREAKK